MPRSFRRRALLMFGLTLACLPGGCDSSRVADAPPPTPLIVIGLDGLEWSVVVEMLDKDHLPNLARVMRAGTFGKLETIRPTSSPIIWTTIATGKRGEEHGITDFTRTSDDGETILLTNADRQTKALWNILSEFDRRVAIVGWWMTYPVEPVNGIMVAQTNTDSDERRLFKGTLVEGVPDQVYPPERQEEILSVVGDVAKRAERLKRRIFGRLPKARVNADRVALRKIDWAVRADAVYHSTALRLLDEQPGYDLSMFYFGGADVLGHRFWNYMYPQLYDPRPPQQNVLMYRSVIKDYYKHLDHLVGTLLDAAPADASFIIISDHGMVPVFTDTRFSAHHHEAPPGFFACSGPVFRKPAEPPDLHGLDAERIPLVCSVYDLAPTILAHFRIPLGRDMAGSIQTRLFDPAYQVAIQPEPRDSHDDAAFLAERTRLQPSADSIADKERLDQLRSLGYVGDDDEEEDEDDEDDDGD